MNDRNRRAFAAVAWTVLMAAAAACTAVSLEEALADKPCGPGGACFSGYVCSSTNICVPVGTQGTGGTAGGTSSGGAEGGGGAIGGGGIGGTGTGGTGTGGTGTGGTGTGGTGTGGTGTGGTGTGGTGTVQTVVYVATVADCIDTGSPNPDQCANPSEALWIDLLTTEAYLRFEPDNTIAGATVVSATLRLRVGTYAQAQGENSGELWQVTSFTRPDLFSGAPSTVGSLLAPDQGAANPGTNIDWPVPVALVGANTPVFFGVIPTSYNSTGYVNLNGNNPPRLIVEYQ